MAIFDNFIILDIGDGGGGEGGYIWKQIGMCLEGERVCVSKYQETAEDLFLIRDGGSCIEMTHQEDSLSSSSLSRVSSEWERWLLQEDLDETFLR